MPKQVNFLAKPIYQDKSIIIMNSISYMIWISSLKSLTQVQISPQRFRCQK